MSSTVALFDLERSNIKSSDPANPGRLIAVGGQRTRGAELTAAGETGRDWQLSAAYAYLDAEITRSTSSLEGVPLQGKRPGLTPRHSANLWLVRKLGGGFSVGGGANYVSERFSSPSQLVTLPGYVICRCRGVLQKQTLRCHARHQNPVL